MFDQETCVLFQGCQRQGLYISNSCPFTASFHDDWQSLCMFIDLWLLSKSWLFSSCVYVPLCKLGVIIPGFWANTIVQDSDSKCRTNVTNNCFLTVWFNLNVWFWILSDLFVCVSSFFFVRFITSLVWFSWSRTALWWSSAAQNTCNAVWICWIGQETSVPYVAKARLYTWMALTFDSQQNNQQIIWQSIDASPAPFHSASKSSALQFILVLNV